MTTKKLEDISKFELAAFVCGLVLVVAVLTAVVLHNHTHQRQRADDACHAAVRSRLGHDGVFQLVGDERVHGDDEKGYQISGYVDVADRSRIAFSCSVHGSKAQVTSLRAR
jgi:hypothetical protein